MPTLPLALKPSWESGRQSRPRTLSGRRSMAGDDLVVVHFGLAAHSVVRAELPRKIARGAPDASPAVLLARLAPSGWSRRSATSPLPSAGDAFRHRPQHRPAIPLRPATPAATGMPSLRMRERTFRCSASRRDAPEKRRPIRPILSRELIRNFVQPVPLGAIRCYLVERLYSALTCTNGCSCWSPHEREIALVCRCKRRARTN
jgi:hypothetical protein